MAHARFWFTGICAIILPVVVRAQNGPDKTLAARTEYIPFETLTLSNAQFLTGDENGKRVTIAGELRMPIARNPVPLVILVHGSNGVGANNDLWERFLNQLGIATFALDGFSARGIVTTMSDQSQLSRLTMIVDVYRSLVVLAKHPGIDASRVALMGFSRGGDIALYASMSRFQKLWNKSGAAFAAYIPFYPSCYDRLINDTDVAAAPIRIIQGDADDFASWKQCRSYVDRLRSAGNDAQMILYPGAMHAFDTPTIPTTGINVATGQTMRNCNIVEDQPGMLSDEATKTPFSYSDSKCVQLGVHVGYSPAATSDSERDVKEILTSAFKLN